MDVFPAFVKQVWCSLDHSKQSNDGKNENEICGRKPQRGIAITLSIIPLRLWYTKVVAKTAHCFF